MPERPLDPETVADCNREFKGLLERYAWAIVRDWSLASDAVQNCFVALAQYGGDVAPEARKSWLFKVVHREALRIRSGEIRYKQSVHDAGAVRETQATYEVTPLESLAKKEQIAGLGKRIEALSNEQQQVLKLRIFEDRTFAEIAEQLQIPLGTALSRMRLALDRLRANEPEEDHEQ